MLGPDRRRGIPARQEETLYPRLPNQSMDQSDHCRDDMGEHYGLSVYGCVIQKGWRLCNEFVRVAAVGPFLTPDVHGS